MDKNGYLIGLSMSPRTSFGKIDFAEQMDEQKVFSAIWELESQVNNGGFEQFFINSDSGTVNFAPTALKTIKADRCATVVERALQTVSPEPLPADAAEKEGLISSLESDARERLSELDTEFFTYPDNLTELLFEFVRSHPQAFGPIEG